MDFLRPVALFPAPHTRCQAADLENMQLEGDGTRNVWNSGRGSDMMRLIQNQTYGLNNPGYVPAAEGGPVDFLRPVALFPAPHTRCQAADLGNTELEGDGTRNVWNSGRGSDMMRLTQNRTYGLNNPGYVPAAEGGPAMFAPPTADPGGPSAPPASMFDRMPGYEGTVAGGGGFLPPPPAYPVPQPTPAQEQPHWNIPSITEDIARSAFIQFASSKCCYSSGPAKDGVITNMEAFNTYRYRLETFTETRSTEWTQEPYMAQPVDAGTQPPPGPWDIPAKTPSFFVDSKQIIRVPYTSSIKPCHVCLGMARRPCNNCSGAGSKVCWVCNGSGFRSNDRCSHCNGRGRDSCIHCHGQGSTECGTCRGRGQLLVYINLTVKWTNNSDDYVVEQSSGLQVDKLSKVSGMELYRDSQYMVYPVIGFPDHQVMQAAQRLVNEHQVKFCQTSRILQQRQTIELIPITRVTYTWKGNSHIYYVYGNEYAVNADGYPATCCCTVM